MVFRQTFSVFLPLLLLPLLLHLLVCPPSAATAAAGRILNGHDLFVPHAARVTGFSIEFSTEGGGTFLTQRHVLTAASVLDQMMIFQVYHGNATMAYAKALSGLGFIHPAYDKASAANDLGIIVLGYPAAEELVIPVALPDFSSTVSSFASPLLVGRTGRVAGYGLRLDAVRGWTLNFPMQAAAFLVLDESRCRAALQERAELLRGDDSQFCTDNAASLCFGYHGSGLTMPRDSDGREAVVGVVSVITNMCHGQFPVIFTRLTEQHVRWITGMIEESSRK